MKEILSRLRRYEILIRKAVNTQMKGENYSVFKGSGLEFDDVRQYQYGDDVRSINWNVTAKGEGTYINTFKEEKEQNVFLVLDFSASQQIGSENRQKIDLAREICALLALSAIKENSSVGFLGFTNQKEKYIRPAKGIKHAYQIIKDVYETIPQGRETNISKALTLVMQIIKRKSVIVLISDMIDEAYEPALKSIAQRHDLIVFQITDSREIELPPLGIIPILDKESQKITWFNSSSQKAKEQLQKPLRDKTEQIAKLCRSYRSDHMILNTRQDYTIHQESGKEYPLYVDKLIQLFKRRNRSRK